MDRFSMAAGAMVLLEKVVNDKEEYHLYQVDSWSSTETVKIFDITDANSSKIVPVDSLFILDDAWTDVSYFENGSAERAAIM